MTTAHQWYWHGNSGMTSTIRLLTPLPFEEKKEITVAIYGCLFFSSAIDYAGKVLFVGGEKNEQ